MRVMITGAAGMLGRAVAAEFASREAEVIALKRTDLDITDLKLVRRVTCCEKPEIVINCAAYTNVDGAETEPHLAFLINGLGPRNLAVACREAGAILVHVSTDYVFDGNKPGAYSIYDDPCPSNIYGNSKLWGEKALSVNTNTYYIVRTSWLFGPGGNNFVMTMLRLGRDEGKVRVVNDQTGSPTYTVDLARGIADLCASGCYGIYHITNQGSVTWHDFAKAIFARKGLSVDLTPCNTMFMGRPARRPQNSVLDPFPLQETIGYLLPTWEDALARYLG
ncbi:dTDP-4-dehydrorhamnose reductase [Pelotomaculum propionicicum]|uniref:dTDP-4-dehydrorhamnose reductase n=2 Tax=Pelotomaculum propionicicum TaxID=258475 RepID=A0A4Y7RNM3_9FIRM|nr:dTDP-4-dehydrorhamnose reductase [Peptococcaceae bacterium]TEB10350.1 dTDP-4-dehydrorhamnose reductase [Pelotomaculum propionicicum]